MTDLLEQLGRPQVTHETYGACKEVFAAQLEEPDTELRVAEDDRGNVVGFCALHFRPRLNQVEPEAWVSELMVSPPPAAAAPPAPCSTRPRTLPMTGAAGRSSLESIYDRREQHLLYTAAGMQDAGRMFRKPL